MADIPDHTRAVMLTEDEIAVIKSALRRSVIYHKKMEAAARFDGYDSEASRYRREGAVFDALANKIEGKRNG